MTRYCKSGQKIKQHARTVGADKQRVRAVKAETKAGPGGGAEAKEKQKESVNTRQKKRAGGGGAVTST